MVTKKIIRTLLIIAIILSILSIAVTLSLNVDAIKMKFSSKPVVKSSSGAESQMGGGQVGVTILPSPNLTNTTNP